MASPHSIGRHFCGELGQHFNRLFPEAFLQIICVNNTLLNAIVHTLAELAFPIKREIKSLSRILCCLAIEDQSHRCPTITKSGSALGLLTVHTRVSTQVKLHRSRDLTTALLFHRSPLLVDLQSNNSPH